MNLQCPYCQSPRVITRNSAKKVGGALGTVGGAATGAANALAGAAIGRTVGMVAGPTGAVLGSLSGALLGALFGAATCGMAGSRLGAMIDERVLDNHQCLDCGQTFSASGGVLPSDWPTSH